ncbi:hypothetical protein [Kitasatospora sp. NPDC057223]|uniref:hypothetical protein n=1 Tax=Kitasatospora sp. NPDC057223 TaxID=3346055 RepID=UPI00363F2F05
MRFRTAGVAAAVAVTVLATTAGRVADANTYADAVLTRAQSQLGHYTLDPYSLRPFDLKVAARSISQQVFKAHLGCRMKTVTSRYGDAAAPGFRGGRVVVGFNLALAATLITCDGTASGGSPFTGRRTTSVQCRPTRASYALVEASGRAAGQRADTVTVRALSLGFDCTAEPAWPLSKARQDEASKLLSNDLSTQVNRFLTGPYATVLRESAGKFVLPDPASR